MNRGGSRRGGYLAIALLAPLLGAALGVNGGAVFQILALENMGLDAREVGLAVGLGAISIPFQIWAARIPLRLAQRNLRLFLAIMALLCWVVAWLLRAPFSRSYVVISAITIAVVAELAVSLLFATSWQPLLSTTVDHGVRQQLNAQARAASSVLLIGIVALVGWVGSDGRLVIVVLIGCLGFALLPAVDRLDSPPSVTTSPAPHVGDEREVGGEHEVQACPGADGEPGMTMLYLGIALAVVPAWPFFLTYSADAFWPSANLGLIGAALTVGSLAAAAGWRPTETRLLGRARISTAILLGCAMALTPITRPVSGGTAGALVLTIVALAAGSGSVVRMALLELVHLRSTPATSVRVLTVLDVIGSTAMQLSFLLAGYLISISAESTWPVDPYQVSLVAAPALLLVVVAFGLEAPARSRTGSG